MSLRNRNATTLPIFDNNDTTATMARSSVNWTLPNAKKPFATVHRGSLEHQQQSAGFVHDVTRVSDIDGAHASSTKKYQHALRFGSKPTFFAPDDVEGAKPRPLVPAAPKSNCDRSLVTRDIEHCYPESKLFSTPRSVNPLNPVYQLPPCRHALPPPEPPRQDPLRIDDIEGTKAKKERVLTLQRNTLDTSDLGNRPPKRVSTSRMLETRDITHPPELDIEPFLKHPRGTNPLDPVYRVSAPRSVVFAGESKAAFQVGPVLGAKPLARYEKPARPVLSLQAADIDGAAPRLRF